MSDVMGSAPSVQSKLCNVVNVPPGVILKTVSLVVSCRPETVTP